MTGEKFTLMQYSVHAILGLIDAEDFVIPEIQRPFVWKRSQVRDLIDSLYNGYPTGYIITWKNPDVKTKDGGKANGKKVLIDGQQRVTALMAAISGRAGCFGRLPRQGRANFSRCRFSLLRWESHTARRRSLT